MDKEVRTFKVIKSFDGIPPGVIVEFSCKIQECSKRNNSDTRIWGSSPAIMAEYMPNHFEEIITTPDHTKAIEACDASIKHWMDDVWMKIPNKYFHRGNIKLFVGSAQCALCEFVGRVNDDEINCAECPLFKIKQGCYHTNSPWKVFVRDITCENCLAMIQAIRDAREFLVKEMEGK